MIEVNYNKHTYKINECMKVIDYKKGFHSFLY